MHMYICINKEENGKALIESLVSLGMLLLLE